MYVSEKFATPQEFEAWFNNNEHPNKKALDEVTDTKLNEWDKKACQVAIADGKIQLKCKDGEVIAEAPLNNAVDGSTIGCSGGCLIVTGVKNQNGGIVKIWLGTTEAYNKITVKDTNNTIYVKTDDNTIATINASLKGLSDRVATLEGRATALEGRATSLEGTAGTHSNEIGSLKTRATNLESRATALEATDKTHTSDISGLKGRATAVEGRATALENTDKTHSSDIAGLKTRATALENTDKTHTSDISGLKSSVSTLTSGKSVIKDGSGNVLNLTLTVVDGALHITTSKI